MENHLKKHQIQKIGVVTSDRMDKTRLVQVIRIKTHPLYQKKMRTRRKFMAHDENNISKMGDFVRIVPTRPLSKWKRWRIIDIVKESGKASKSNDSTEISTDSGR